jgi:tetratricopeptide (TPR) repeat protein
MDLSLGKMLRHRGEVERAIEVLLPLLSPDPAVPDETRNGALFGFGLCLCCRGDAAGALRAADELEARITPSDTGAFRAQLSDLRSLTLLVAGDFNGAISSTEAGIAAYTDSPKAEAAGYLYNVRGIAQLHLGDRAAATNELEHARLIAAKYGIDRLEGICNNNLA